MARNSRATQTDSGKVLPDYLECLAATVCMTPWVARIRGHDNCAVVFIPHARAMTIVCAASPARALAGRELQIPRAHEIHQFAAAG